jgi:hypothetical protein
MLFHARPLVSIHHIIRDCRVITWRGTMATEKLTTKAVDAIVRDKRDVFVWDTELSGFGVRVTSGGAKSYFYQF